MYEIAVYNNAFPLYFIALVLEMSKEFHLA